VIDQVEPQRAYEAAAPNGATPRGVTPQAQRDSANSAAKISPTERLGLR